MRGCQEAHDLLEPAPSLPLPLPPAAARAPPLCPLLLLTYLSARLAGPSLYRTQGEVLAQVFGLLAPRELADVESVSRRCRSIGER